MYIPDISAFFTTAFFGFVLLQSRAMNPGAQVLLGSLNRGRLTGGPILRSNSSPAIQVCELDASDLEARFYGCRQFKFTGPGKIDFVPAALSSIRASYLTRDLTEPDIPTRARASDSESILHSRSRS
jgi:hypothetical protein